MGGARHGGARTADEELPYLEEMECSDSTTSEHHSAMGATPSHQAQIDWPKSFRMLASQYPVVDDGKPMTIRFAH